MILEINFHKNWRQTLVILSYFSATSLDSAMAGIIDSALRNHSFFFSS